MCAALTRACSPTLLAPRLVARLSRVMNLHRHTVPPRVHSSLHGFLPDGHAIRSLCFWGSKWILSRTVSGRHGEAWEGRRTLHDSPCGVISSQERGTPALSPTKCLGLTDDPEPPCSLCPCVGPRLPVPLLLCLWSSHHTYLYFKTPLSPPPCIYLYSGIIDLQRYISIRCTT